MAADIPGKTAGPTAVRPTAVRPAHGQVKAVDARLLEEIWVRPDPDNPRLTQRVEGLDESGNPVATAVVVERPLTVFLNSREVVTLMTLGEHPKWLAVGFLINQNMIRSAAEIDAVEHDEELDVVVVRTGAETDFEAKLAKKTRTSGCAQGTVFGDLMERFEEVELPAGARLAASELYALTRAVNALPSLYLQAGAIHGCVLAAGGRPLIYVEDVGRHNAVDTIAGYMALKEVPAGDKVFYTTGRLTSEMVIKTVQMGIPILVSRSGFTAWGVDLARQARLTLIGRAKGRRFLVLAAPERLVYDADPSEGGEEDARHARKGARGDE